jgi:hypothetical protein
MPVVSAALEAVATKIPSFETRLGGARFDDRGNGPGRNWLTANAGQGRGSPGRVSFGCQIRRNTGPDSILAASSQAVRARTGHNSVWR